MPTTFFRDERNYRTTAPASVDDRCNGAYHKRAGSTCIRGAVGHVNSLPVGRALAVCGVHESARWTHPGLRSPSELPFARPPCEPTHRSTRPNAQRCRTGLPSAEWVGHPKRCSNHEGATRRTDRRCRQFAAVGPCGRLGQCDSAVTHRGLAPRAHPRRTAQPSNRRHRAGCTARR